MKRRKVRNTVWITADTHYTSANYYDPGKAQFTDFDPFWEFVCGPIHAGTFGPGQLDNTFGPQLIFQNASPKARTWPRAQACSSSARSTSTAPPGR